MPLLYEDYLFTEDLFVPYKVYVDRKNTLRFSTGSTGGILRIPFFLNKEQREIKLEEFKRWFAQTLIKNKTYLSSIGIKNYKNTQQLKTIFGTTPIQHFHRAGNTIRYYLAEEGIKLYYNHDYNGGQLHKLLKKQLLNAAKNLYLKEVIATVIKLNVETVNKKISKIDLSDTATKWGSCSSTGRVQLSTKLLFSTETVLNSVIYHELAHLVHFNHTKDFYDLLESMDPFLTNSSDWLKQNAHRCQP